MSSISALRKLASGLGRIALPLLLLWLTGCNGRQLSGLPQQLVGEWRTTETRYQGRSMRMEADRIIFGMGGAGADRMEQVEAVRVTNGANGEEYRIKLRNVDGSPDWFTVDFTGANGGELRLKGQPKIVWRNGKVSSLVSIPDPYALHPLQTPDVTVPLRERPQDDL